MSSKLIAGNATNGSSLSADTTGILEIQTGSTPTTAISIDASQNVGIGTSSPQAKLDVIYTPSSSGGSNTNTLRSGFSLNGIGTTQPVSAFRFTSTYFAGIGGTNYANQWVTDSANALTTEILNTGATPIIFGNSGTERMRIDANGVIRTVTTTGFSATTGTLATAGYSAKAGISGAFSGNIFNINWTGSPFLWIDSTNVGQLATVSDYRIKKNIENQTAPALERIEKLRPVTYERTIYENLYSDDGVVREGFIAHELQAIIPSAVEGKKDDPNQIQSLSLDALCSVMVKAIQELNAKVDAQAAEIKALKGVA
jgi:hypothetical protein